MLMSPRFRRINSKNFDNLISCFPDVGRHCRQDPNMLLDFATLHPETIFQGIFVSTALGIPDGFWYTNGFTINVFKLVSDAGRAVYCKFHWLVGLSTAEQH